MSIASLLLKGDASTSLSTLVERALQKNPPYPEFELQLNPTKLILTRRNSNDKTLKSSQTDEGFESDIDTLSIVSFDEAFNLNLSSNTAINCSKTPETDSANGSASSDSDTDSPPAIIIQEQKQKNEAANQAAIDKEDISNNIVKETFNLVNCICYTDVKFTNILVFVIEEKALVFKFDDVSTLQNFYTKFAALKAATNKVIYNRNTITKKFNLLQKTENNGITHIQIKREPSKPVFVDDDGPSSIISLNTPEDNLNQLINTSVQHIRSLNEFNSTNTINSRLHNKIININNINHIYERRRSFDKSASASDLLDIENETSDKTLIRKIWTSNENILDVAPKRPERKRKNKGKAPTPPEIEIKQDILSGQYVRVNVVKSENPEPPKLLLKGQGKEAHPKKIQSSIGAFPSSKPSLNLYVKNKAAQILRYAPKKFESSTLTRHKTPPQETWTNSIPRLFKQKHQQQQQPRSKSETRVVQPMAYRYIDTTLNYPVTYVPVATSNGRILKSHEAPPYSFGGGTQSYKTHNSNIGNRLFGLSPKLREFDSHSGRDVVDGSKTWKSSEKLNGNLKSVIKKDDNRRKNEKKVTFSAYTTVQVV